MQVKQSIEGRARQYINYGKCKDYDGNVNLDSVTKNQTRHKTLHRCPKCGSSMMINKISKKEWCEYCD